jgi:putative transposase
MTSPSALSLDTYYHIFNRGNNRESVFLEDQNYYLFMQLYSKYIPPIADTIAYCLLRNHFHLYIRTKSAIEILDSLGKRAINRTRLLHFPSRQFSNFFNAYAKIFNLTYHRTGSLFQHPFKRIPVNDTLHINRLIAYIHKNPQHHGFVDDFRDWPFSSFHCQDSQEGISITDQVALRFFQNSREYHRIHSRKSDNRLIKLLLVDDFV